MFPEPMSRFALRRDESPPDPSHILEQNILADFPPDLALDLVLNELVVRAAEATRASAAALALVRGDEMVCRAATGHMAPGLGIALKPRNGLSGACLQTHQPQLSVDTECDPRVDPDVSRRLGIRSILAVPVFDINDNNDIAKFTGVLEVFSTSPAAFSTSDQKLLGGFAEECARIRHAALRLSQRKPVAAASSIRILPALIPSDLTPSDFTAAGPLPALRPPSQTWVLVLGALTILATIALSVLIGSRIGWFRPTASHSQASQLIPAETSSPATAADHRTDQSSSERGSERASERVPEKVPEKVLGKAPAKASRKASASPATSTEDDLVVYEKGKVIFRLKPTPAKTDSDSIVEAASRTRIAATDNSATKITTIKNDTSPSIRLDPDQAEELLQSRTEPEYPPAALAAHRAGNVVLEVHVADDGSVSNIRTLSGDPLLATAAAAAVRSWRYQPYRQNDHPSRFQTDVTLTFTPPN
jgi:TonB family protein